MPGRTCIEWTSVQFFHKRHLKEATNKNIYDKLSKKYGIRYSVLTNLKYFNMFAFTLFTPSTAKNTWKIWKENIFSNQQLAEINKKARNINTSADIWQSWVKNILELWDLCSLRMLILGTMVPIVPVDTRVLLFFFFGL